MANKIGQPRKRTVMKQIHDQEEFDEIKASNDLYLIMYETEDCGHCEDFENALKVAWDAILAAHPTIHAFKLNYEDVPDESEGINEFPYITLCYRYNGEILELEIPEEHENPNALPEYISRLIQDVQGGKDLPRKEGKQAAQLQLRQELEDTIALTSKQIAKLDMAEIKAKLDQVQYGLSIFLEDPEFWQQMSAAFVHLSKLQKYLFFRTTL